MCIYIYRLQALQIKDTLKQVREWYWNNPTLHQLKDIAHQCKHPKLSLASFVAQKGERGNVDTIDRTVKGDNGEVVGYIFDCSVRRHL